jgi:hypothetical protein
VLPVLAPSQAESDDFFTSLVTDLSKDLDSGSQKGSGGNSMDNKASSLDEDDFFASLMSEILNDETEELLRRNL